jgi:diaminohydroxyphosphoribosylaminopyrimidine deaminase/5-amino-6-(5-phosphoribosylamino)uracil reductase
MPDRDRHFLRMAARLALRGHGGAEPNPLVGAVVVSRDGVTVGWGFHRKFGGPHAEVIALQRAGTNAAGATLYCTLEPCNHPGKTPPCTQAIIAA